MIYRALRSFSGVISVSEGSEVDINDKVVETDLLKAGYIAKIEETKKEKPKPTKRVLKKSK